MTKRGRDSWGRMLQVRMSDSWKTRLKDGDWVWVFVSSERGWGRGDGIYNYNLKKFEDTIIEVKVIAKLPKPCKTCTHVIDTDKVVWDLHDPGHCNITLEFPSGFQLAVDERHIYKTRAAAAKVFKKKLQDRLENLKGGVAEKQRSIAQSNERIQDLKGFIEMTREETEPRRQPKRKMKVKVKRES